MQLKGASDRYLSDHGVTLLYRPYQALLGLERLLERLNCVYVLISQPDACF